MAGTDDSAQVEVVRSSVQRMLDRVRFDLHDGPQQDLHLLAMDLQLFREQLLPSIAQDPNRPQLLGRLDDLAAQLVALDRSIRRLSASLKSPFLAEGTLPDALAEVNRAFAARTGVTPELELSGAFDLLSDSQQIALLAVVQEALSNIRKHSDATAVTVSLAAGAQGVTLAVTDDGRGFDPAATLPRARREGHLGVVGMHERVRMLGGETRIESRPGGPTVVSVALPPWPGDGGSGEG